MYLLTHGLTSLLNTLRPRQNGRHFADDTLNHIFLNANVRISIKISLKFAPKGPINNISALVQIMAWCRPGDKPLSEPMMVCLLAHICVAQLQWVNTLMPRQNGRHFADDIFKCIFLNENASISLRISLKFVPKVRFNNISALVQIMAWRRPGDKPLSEPVMVSLLTHICVTRLQWVKPPLKLAQELHPTYDNGYDYLSMLKISVKPCWEKWPNDTTGCFDKQTYHEITRRNTLPY